MQERPGRLPPLATLVVFESAARLSSFTRAAHELNVTQGAVSRQVRALEEHLGKPLFTRAHRAVILTPTGRHYAQSVRAALGQIADATRAVRSPPGQPRVTLGTTTAMASLWLIPRLARFRALQPDIDIRVLAADRPADFAAEAVDLALYYAREGDARGGRRVLEEECFPVCSPAYLAEAGTPRSASELARHTLLVLEGELPGWVNWHEWFRRLGVKDEEPGRTVHINSYPLLIQAAVAGQGIALGWRYLLDDLIAAGALVRPLEETLRGPGAFWLFEPDGSPPRREVALLREFLLDELGTQGGTLEPAAR